MSDEWRQVKQIFHAALRQRANEREAFLDEACADDDDLRREVESLLSSYDDDSFLENPAAEFLQTVAQFSIPEWTLRLMT